MSLTLRFLGAAQEVTGSMYLLETPGGRLLVDCGFHQGRRRESRQRNSHLPAELAGAQACVLTHAHIDHSGSLPTLVKQGFGGTIWTTPATRDVCAHLLRDSARIQETDARYLNRKFASDPDWEPIEPIYDERDAIRAVGRMAGVPYHLPFSPLPGISARFFDAGHILGSAQLLLEVDGPPRRRILFSGDLGRANMPIIRDPETPPTADYVILESTYGARLHGSIAEMGDRLVEVVTETVRRRGKVIIPSFALGRSQEIVYTLHQLWRDRRIPDVPIFVDSPLSTNLTAVFQLHPECYDDEARAFIEETGDAFSFARLRYIQSPEESMALNTLAEPAIIIAASGMCESGRVLHHLRNHVEDQATTVLIVGFQAQHTLGRRLVERRPRVRIFGVERDLHARVVVLNGFSAHADRGDLLAYARRQRGARRLFLVHGEPEQQGPLADTLVGEGFSMWVPGRGEAAVLD